jgi:hypothetical protein
VTTESGHSPNQDSDEEAYRQQAEAFVNSIDRKFEEAEVVLEQTYLECMPAHDFMGYDTPIILFRRDEDYLARSRHEIDSKYGNHVYAGKGPQDDPRTADFHWHNGRIWMNQPPPPAEHVDNLLSYRLGLAQAKGVSLDDLNFYGMPLEFDEGNQLIDWIEGAMPMPGALDVELNNITEIIELDTSERDAWPAPPAINEFGEQSNRPALQRLARFILSRLRKGKS